MGAGPGGGSWSGGVSALGGLLRRAGIPACTEADPPHTPVDVQTPVKT